jgi:hypothetical protein
MDRKIIHRLLNCEITLVVNDKLKFNIRGLPAYFHSLFALLDKKARSSLKFYRHTVIPLYSVKVLWRGFSTLNYD